MWTVTLRLWPQVVVAHLLGGLLTLTLLALLTQRLFHLRWRLTLPELGRLHSLRPWLWLALLMTLSDCPGRVDHGQLCRRGLSRSAHLPGPVAARHVSGPGVRPVSPAGSQPSRRPARQRGSGGHSL